MKNKIIEIKDYYYNPNLECTCGAIFADTHRSYCKRRNKPYMKEKKEKIKNQKEFRKKNKKQKEVKS